MIKDAENDYVDYSYAEIAARTKTTEITVLVNESSVNMKITWRLDEPNKEGETENENYGNQTSASEKQDQGINENKTKQTSIFGQNIICKRN